MNEKVIYPELSYKIIGVAFNAFSEIGFGRSEKFYQKAFTQELDEIKLPYAKEKLVAVHYKDMAIGKYYLDFIVDNKIVVELKTRPHLGYVHIKQIMEYLKTIDYKLAILIYFTKDGVKYRRIINAK